MRFAAALSPTEMALTGGLLADRFAWIFMAGYQAAIRHVFPELALNGWAAFAVSEERGDGARPGLTGILDDDAGLGLAGTKSWVAASRHVQDLVVSVALGDETRFLALPVTLPGIDVETRPPGRVLPDLSQGSATFTDVHVPQPRWLDAERAQRFAVHEVLFIYLAFLASSWATTPARRDEIAPLISTGCDQASRPALTWDAAMLELDGGVQRLLRGLREGEREGDEKWRKEYKLIAMYSRQNIGKT